MLSMSHGAWESKNKLPLTNIQNIYRQGWLHYSKLLLGYCPIWVIGYIAWGISEVLGKQFQLHLKKIHSSKSQNQVYSKKQKEIVY